MPKKKGRKKAKKAEKRLKKQKKNRLQKAHFLLIERHISFWVFFEKLITPQPFFFLDFLPHFPIYYYYINFSWFFKDPHLILPCHYDWVSLIHESYLKLQKGATVEKSWAIGEFKLFSASYYTLSSSPSINSNSNFNFLCLQIIFFTDRFYETPGNLISLFTYDIGVRSFAYWFWKN